MRFVNKTGARLTLLAVVSVFMAGCGQEASEPNGGSTPAGESSHDDHAGDKLSHSGWWCAEHGVPEEQCSVCSAKAAKDFKAKGDWCEEHHRAESQCFQCDPSRAERFAALYEAKFGTKPPKREDEE